MRNKKSLLSFGILALVLVLGVGYAAISEQVLNITGTATSLDRTIDVRFVSAESGDADQGVTATGTITGDQEATITVTGLSEELDSAKVAYTVENHDVNLEAVVTAEVVEIKNAAGKDLSEYFDVTFENSPVTLAPNISEPGTDDIVVVVSLKKVPIEVEDSSANIKIKLTAVPQQPGATQD